MGETPHLIFTIQGTLFALEALLVHEIIWLPELTPLSILPDYMPGVVMHRGHVVPVMDLGRQLGFPAGTYHMSDQVIFIEWEGIGLGLIVNEVLDACTIPPKKLPPSTLPSGGRTPTRLLLHTLASTPVVTCCCWTSERSYKITNRCSNRL